MSKGIEVCIVYNYRRGPDATEALGGKMSVRGEAR